MGLRNDLLLEDADFTAAQLRQKYNNRDEENHPLFPQEEWRMAVENNQTLLGYWDWVFAHIDEELNA